MRAAAFLLAGCLLATAATARTPDANILTYAGPDCTHRLIEGAKKEGELTYYSAMIVNQALRPLPRPSRQSIPS